MHTEDELLDLVNDQDEVIDQKRRSKVYEEGLSNFRVINAFVINSEGKIWIPRRTAHKRIFPLCLDMSVGGHVESGETYEQTLKRETEEELKINTDECAINFLGHLSPSVNDVSAHMNVYEIKIEAVPEYNKRDFIEAFWLTPQEAVTRIENGDPAKSDLPKLIKYFYLKEGSQSHQSNV